MRRNKPKGKRTLALTNVCLSAPWAGSKEGPFTAAAAPVAAEEGSLPVKPGSNTRSWGGRQGERLHQSGETPEGLDGSVERGFLPSVAGER
ncbi:unnamed protein product [Gulo gulo]|uniref:Uncharacterized protein n=1 Tax=Gulo gulo TaxID=48420 RepID=A0A9X9PYZ8_GULGU|nr:unnamed protein product [Gulo gulo]